MARPLKNEDKGEAKEERAREAGEETYRKQAREAGKEAKNKGEKEERRRVRTGSETASVGFKGQSLTYYFVEQSPLGYRLLWRLS